MSIPQGLKVTKLVNGMDYAPLSTGEAHILEEEIDRMNTAYRGYGYAKDTDSVRSQHSIIVLSKQIEKKEWVLYSGVDADSQWKALVEGKRIEKAYLEITFKGTEKRTMQFAFAPNPDFVEWLESLVRTHGIIGIMDRLDMQHPIAAIQVTGIPLDLPAWIIKTKRYYV